MMLHDILGDEAPAFSCVPFGHGAAILCMCKVHVETSVWV